MFRQRFFSVAAAATSWRCSSQCSATISEENDGASKGWKEAFSTDGHKFYYHETTGESSWTHPTTMKFNKAWDGRNPGKKGVSHQIVLIRHGQYEENEKGDEKRKLTPLGRKQESDDVER